MVLLLQGCFATSTTSAYPPGEELLEHINGLMEEAKRNDLDLTHPLEVCVSNVISAMILGRRFDKSDPMQLRLKALIDEQMDLLGKPDFWWVKFLGSASSPCSVTLAWMQWTRTCLATGN